VIASPESCRVLLLPPFIVVVVVDDDDDDPNNPCLAPSLITAYFAVVEVFVACVLNLGL